MKILLVDDDSFLRDMYATKFKEEGDTVDAAETPQDALLQLKDKHFDVVLTDMVMPGMQGDAFVREAVKITTDTKFIVLSNQSEEKDKSAAAAAGAIGYIVKADVIPSEVVKEVHKLTK